MQYLLVTVTLVSTAVAIVMCAIVVRMLREARRRSDARVDALLSAADTSRLQPLDAFPAVEPEPSPGRRAGARVRPSETFADDLRAADSSRVAGIDGLFAERETASPWPRRLGVAGVAAAILLAAVFVFGPADRGGVAGKPAAMAAPPPLELLSLTHSPAASGLTITGLVQNPAGGAALADVTAVALLFAADGAFIASGRAPLDFSRLDPGSESPFVVSVPASNRVARYRVSFRRSDGAVIAHVDRRGGPPVARKD